MNTEYLVIFKNIAGFNVEWCCEILTDDQINSDDFLCKDNIVFKMEKSKALQLVFGAIVHRI